MKVPLIADIPFGAEIGREEFPGVLRIRNVQSHRLTSDSRGVHARRWRISSIASSRGCIFFSCRRASFSDSEIWEPVITGQSRHRRHLHRYDRAQGCLETGFERMIAEEFLDNHPLSGTADTMDEDILHADPGG
jgi:hypothetical protein